MQGSDDRGSVSFLGVQVRSPLSQDIPHLHYLQIPSISLETTGKRCNLVSVVPMSQMRTCGSETLSDLLKATRLEADPERKSKSSLTPKLGLLPISKYLGTTWFFLGISPIPRVRYHLMRKRQLCSVTPEFAGWSRAVGILCLGLDSPLKEHKASPCLQQSFILRNSTH